MSKEVFFSDLDQTLLYSYRSVSALLSSTDERHDLVVAEIYQDAPFGYIEFNANAQLGEISRGMDFVPTTTRTVAQYERIRFPQVKVEYAVTTNGGVILHNGVPDSEWSEYVVNNVLAESAFVSDVYNILEAEYGSAEWVRKMYQVEDFFMYFALDRELMPETFVDDMEERASTWNYTVSLQGRKLYLIPANLSKGNAVKEVRNRLGSSFMSAAGDSILDKSILLIADEAWRPAHGELEEENFQLPHLRVTKERNFLAGAEIIQGVYNRLK